MSFTIGDRVTLRPSANPDFLREIRRAHRNQGANRSFLHIRPSRAHTSYNNFFRNLDSQLNGPTVNRNIDPIGTIIEILPGDLYKVEFEGIDAIQTIGAMMLTKATNLSVSGGRCRRRTARRKNRKASRKASRK